MISWNKFAIPVPLLPYVPLKLGTMASFVRITTGEVHGEIKRRDDYTASRRVGTMHCYVVVSFNVLPAQRVSFDVLPKQRVYSRDYISDALFFCGITSLRRICGEFRCATSTGSSLLRDGHDGSYDETTATIRRKTRDLSSPPPDVKCRDNDVRRQRRRRRRREEVFDCRLE